jgi:hypothetical protein
MNRHKLLILVVVALGLVAFGLAGSLPNQAAAGNPIPITGTYLSNYSVKFVCGESKGPVLPYDQGEGLVKPGNYATEINIHNYFYRDVVIRKKVLVLAFDGYTPPVGPPLPEVRAREPQPAMVYLVPSAPLRPDGATMDDCYKLWQMAYGTLPPPPQMPLFIGYLVLLSPLDLDVDVVYTAEVPAAGTQGNGISIDVERVNGKRVYCPYTEPICAGPTGQAEAGEPSAPPDD